MLLLLPLLFAFELGYLYLADRFNIIDKPNQRSSHSKPTIRGGGIIFPIAWILYAVWDNGAYPWFTLGVLLISAVSFLDDLKPVAARIRLLIHLTAFILLFVELNAFQLLPWWGVVLALIIGIGIINAYNFMDGINGITGMYTLSVLIPLLLATWSNDMFSFEPMTDLANPTLTFSHLTFNIRHSIFNTPFPFLTGAILVFGFFNFRKKARCFAGDVGSVTIGFIIFFLLFSLFLRPDDTSGEPSFKWWYILYLAVYGVDTILTISYRLWLRENIFEAHRRHLYQYLVNEQRWPHLVVAALYAIVQMGINFFVQPGTNMWLAISMLIALGLLYLWVRFFAFSFHKNEKTSVRDSKKVH